MINSVFSLMEEIPGTVWGLGGVIIGASFSFLGNVYTSGQSRHRMVEQFNHERELKNAERDLNLRKDVFLSVAEVAQAGLLTLEKFNNLAIPVVEVTDEFFTKAAAVAKLRVIATQDTVRAVDNVFAELSTAFIRMTALRAPLDFINQKIAVLDPMIKMINDKQESWLQAMEQHNLERSDDRAKWEILNKNWQFERDRWTEKVDERNALFNERTALHMQLFKATMSENGQLAKAMICPLVEMRRELGIPTDQKAFEEISNHSAEKVERATNSFFADLTASHPELLRNTTQQPASVQPP